MTIEPTLSCPDCENQVALTPALDRRGFLKSALSAASGLVITSAAPVSLARAFEPTRQSAAESAVGRLYKTFTKEQREVVCLPFNDERLKRINANWQITKLTVEDFSTEQQALIQEVVKGVMSPEGYERMLKQMDGDAGGLEAYSIAVFGDPDKEKFQFTLTGRHVTLRADGNTIENSAFGGPVIYGHGEGDGKKGLPGNVYYYQTQKANEVFKALDGKQREVALIDKAPSEAAVRVQGKAGKFAGIRVGELANDQKALVESVVKVILAPYRKEDVDEVMGLLKAGDGLDQLRMSFYKSEDVGNDQEWDIWRVEGPTFVSHFRGAPHVHAYLNVKKV